MPGCSGWCQHHPAEEGHPRGAKFDASAGAAAGEVRISQGGSGFWACGADAVEGPDEYSILYRGVMECLRQNIAIRGVI